MTLNELFKNTTYDDTLFSVEDKSTIESRIFMKSVRGSEVPYITCAIRDKEIKLTPEEAVRQLYIYKLMNDYGYAASRIQLETPIHFGREVKRADIAIMDKDRPMVPYIIVELKKPKLTDGKEQLKSYCNATGAPIGVWTNGEQISCYNRKDPNFFEEISDIPKATQKLSDIINEKFTYEDLKRKDKISTQKKSLRSLIKEMEDEVLASAGVDSFEEIFKLIFTKLYDELICANDPTAYLQFRNTGDTDYELKEKIQGLFDDAKKKWEGIFTDESKILLSPSHLAVCVASLQDRSSSMTAQPHLTITLIRDLLVCNYSNSFKDKVEKYFTTLEKLNHQAQILYSEAKQILIKELKVCTEGITSDSYTTKYLSTSFKVSGRLDAEYYQPKYDGYLSALEQFETTKIPNEFDVLKNSGTNYAEGVSDVGVIKTKQLTNSGVNTDGIESYFTHETCIENKSTLVVNNDVVFASMGVGSLGKVSLFSYDGDKPFVTDSTLRIYRAKKHTHVLPEVLCIFLQSAIGQELIYRYVVGSTGIINIYDDDIAKIPIPILDGEIQKDIAEKVQNSFALRRQSKQLLEYAKQAVEMAIEQGEDAALVWLKERSGE